MEEARKCFGNVDYIVVCKW